MISNLVIKLLKKILVTTKKPLKNFLVIAVGGAAVAVVSIVASLTSLP